MIGTGRKVIYEAFGFRIRSDFPMPELQLHNDQERAEISIRKGDLSGLWQNIARPGILLYAVGDSVLFHVPGTAIFCVQAGETIVVSPLEGMDEDKVRLYLLGTCMAVILLQRQYLPLHGSAIKIGNKAYAVVGDSGAGKSTLASAVMRMGFSMISDDLIAVTFDERRRPMVIPSFPQQKLWEESIRQLDMQPSRYRPLFERENKFAVPVKEQFYNRAIGFGGIFELVKTDAEGVEVNPLQGLQAIHTLYRHTFRNLILKRAGLQEWHFHMTVQLLKEVAVYRMTRPSSGCSPAALASVLLSNIDGGNSR